MLPQPCGTARSPWKRVNTAAPRVAPAPGPRPLCYSLCAHQAARGRWCPPPRQPAPGGRTPGAGPFLINVKVEEAFAPSTITGGSGGCSGPTEGSGRSSTVAGSRLPSPRTCVKPSRSSVSASCTARSGNRSQPAESPVAVPQHLHPVACCPRCGSCQAVGSEPSHQFTAGLAGMRCVAVPAR